MWSLPINVRKCLVISLDQDVMAETHAIVDSSLLVADAFKDLDVLEQNNLSKSRQCVKVPATGMSKRWILPWSFSKHTVHNFIVLFITMIRTIMEYCAHTWCPYLKKDSQLLKRVHLRFTKLLFKLQQPSYKRRLETLYLYSSTNRRDRET